ncbi:MAG: hypothetical protein IJ642_12120 [Oscillospiraceae bacterium]|nr:hypothetical protein [Oscillospiraceae bacterium]
MREDFHDTASAYCKRRDSAVIQAVSFGNLEPLRNLIRQNRLPVPDDDVLISTAHRLCCHSPSVPEPLREKSAEWIKNRGDTE